MLNDDKILKLQEAVKVKKSKMMKPHYKRITNCSITINNETHNINTLSEFNAKMLLIDLVLIKQVSESRNWDNFKISGYTPQEWIIDIDNKILEFLYKEQKKELNKLEKRLTELLSEDKKVELELGDIENLLK